MNSLSLSFPYVVVDVETTGFGRADRILEIAIIACDAGGEEVERFESLVQPDRDIPNASIHGITPTMVADAPTFAEVSSQVARLLSERVFVAHNASFDARMISQEFSRLGVELPPAQQWAIDTMVWSRRLLPGAPGKLNQALDSLGIINAHTHSAMGDTAATVQLFLELLRRGAVVSAQPLPDYVFTNLQYAVQSPRPTVTRSAPQGPTLLPRPVATGQREADAYQDLLIRVLDDEVVTDVERLQLYDAAQRLGLNEEEAHEVHVEMLQRMAVVAWADGILTQEERARIEEAAHALGVDDAQISGFLAQPVGPRINIFPGCRIALSGELALPRGQWEQRIINLGLSTGGVTKNTVALVTADPHSHSGKAKKARAYGIPVLSEAELAWLLRNYECSAGAATGTTAGATSAAATSATTLSPQPVDLQADVEETPQSAEENPLEAIFPWAWPREEISAPSVLVLTTEWIRERAEIPLHELSPRLMIGDALESVDRSRRVVQRWFEAFSEPLEASVLDLKDIRGMGPKSIADAVHAVALAALDAEDPAAYSFGVEHSPYDVAPLEQSPFSSASTANPANPSPSLLEKVVPMLTWLAITETPAVAMQEGLPEEVRTSLRDFTALSSDIRSEIAETTVAELCRIWEDDARCEDIFTSRLTTAQPQSLEEIGTRWGITRERVRQLEKIVKEKALTATKMHRAALPILVPQAQRYTDFLAAHPEFATTVVPSVNLAAVALNLQE
ncbi:exonuclease domain-containing protein, partial [Corynebacterium flavescens]